MKLNFNLSLIVFFAIINSYSQPQDIIQIQGVFRERVCNSTLTFFSFSSGLEYVVTTEIKANSFHLSLPITIAAGVYQLQYNTDCGKQFIDIIINGTDRKISFITNLNNEFPSFTGSEENTHWSSYKKQSKYQEAKLRILYDFLSFYPEAQDLVVSRVKEAVIKERNEFYDNFRKFVSVNQGTWAEKMVSNQPYYFSDPSKNPTKRDFIRSDYYWDDINTTDPLLLNSPLYGVLIDKYMDFKNSIVDTSFDTEFQVKKRIVIVIQKFGGNAATKSFAVSHLKEKFTQNKQYSMLSFLEEHYGIKGIKP
jgi:hypothetical protein